MATRSVAYRLNDLESKMGSIKEDMQTMMKQIGRLIKTAEKKREGAELSRSMAFESRKPEIPTFNGSDPNGWILQVEKYFARKYLNNEEQLEVATSSFEGVASRWFRRENQRRPFRRWEDLKSMILRQFCSSGEWFVTLKQGVTMERDNIEKSLQEKGVNTERGKEVENAKERDRDRGRVGLVDDHLETLPTPSPPSPLSLLSFSPSPTPLLSSILPPLRRMNTPEKGSVASIRSQNEKEKISSEPIWPKPNQCISIWPNKIPSAISLTANGSDQLADDLRKLPPPQPRPPSLPLPWPPPSPAFTPLPPPAFTPLPPPAFTPLPPPLALNPRDLEESVKLLWQKFIKKLDGELHLPDVGGATDVGPEIEVHFNSVISLINPKTMMLVGIIEGLCVVVFIDNGEIDTHSYISKKVENKMGDSYVEFAIMSLIIMVVVVCLNTLCLVNPTTGGIHKLVLVGKRRIMGDGANIQCRWNKNSTVIGRLNGFLNRYNSVADGLVGINRTSYFALNGTDEGLDTRSEVVNFNDERENEGPWLLGTKDTSLLGLKLNRRDLQSREVYWRALRWGTIDFFCYTYIHGRPPLVFDVNDWNEFLFDFFPP